MAPREDYDDETNIVFNVYNGDHNGEDYDDETDVIDDVLTLMIMIMVIKMTSMMVLFMKITNDVVHHF